MLITQSQYMGFTLKLLFHFIHYINNFNETAISQALADNRPKISQTLWYHTRHMNASGRSFWHGQWLSFICYLFLTDSGQYNRFLFLWFLCWPLRAKGTLLSGLKFLNFVHHSVFWKNTSFPSSSERVERNLWVHCVELFQSLGQGPVYASFSFHLRTETALASETLSSFRILDNGQCIEA